MREIRVPTVKERKEKLVKVGLTTATREWKGDGEEKFNKANLSLRPDR